MVAWRAMFCVVIGLSLLGCVPDRGAPGGEAGDVLVFAASDLQAAFAGIEARFEESTGQGLTVVFGSTGNIATQIANGAPADIFFAANESFLDGLESAGLLESETRKIYALGRLAVVWHPWVRQPGGVEDLADDAYRTIALANPEHAPYGVAGREALRTAGVWERVESLLVFGENIAQALQFVQTGNADAGIVALGLVLRPNARPHLVVPDSAHAPLRQAAAVIRESPRAEAARRLLDFVTGPEGQAVLRQYGFDPPES